MSYNLHDLVFPIQTACLETVGTLNMMDLTKVSLRKLVAKLQCTL